ncbi:MAG: hypothetical protein ACNA7Y_06450, partial [Gammaproteobacteria bacterium]
MKKIIVWILLFVVLGFIGVVYWDYQQSSIRSEDAHLNAEAVPVSAQVAGPVSHIYVYDNQYVTQHQVLFDIGDKAHVLSPMSGFIEKMNLKEGTDVYAHRPLFEIVSDDYYG